MTKIFPVIVKKVTTVAGGDFVTTELEKLTLQFKVITVQGSIELRTPVFVYSTEVQGAIKITNLALIYRALEVQGAVSGVLGPLLTAMAAGSINMVALTEVGTTEVSGALVGKNSLAYGALIARGDLNMSSLVADYDPVTVEGSIRKSALVMVGETRVSTALSGMLAFAVANANVLKVNIAPSSAGIGLTYTCNYETNGSFTLTLPNGVASLQAESWAGGGGGGNANVGPGGGGGGGGYARENALAVAAGDVITLVVGAGGAVAAAGAQTRIHRAGVDIAVASGGGAGGNGGVLSQGAGGANGSGITGDVLRDGGDGGGGGGTLAPGGGGGGGAGSNNAGGNGASDGTAGAGGAVGGGTGSTGAGTGIGGPPATAASAAGGGGGGTTTTGAGSGGARGRGQLQFAV